jgi:hypothetical protein
MARFPALAMSALVLAACAGPVPPMTAPASLPTVPTVVATVLPGPTATASPSHAPAADDVVLRMTVGGGLRYPGATVEAPPLFTLYGDGLVLYTVIADVPDSILSVRYELLQARLTAEQSAALIDFALSEGGLATARALYADVPVADDLTTTFLVRLGSVSKTVAVYALGYNGPDVPDREARRSFERLADELHEFGSRVGSGEVEGLGAFEPDAYEVTLDDPIHEEIVALPWPWPDLAPRDFVQANGGWRQAVITHGQAARLSDPVNDVTDDLVLAGPDGASYLVRIRPLLPDQVP